MIQTRKTDTKQKIKESFTQLIKEKGLTAVTVSDITRAADINRGTFYLHYLDKIDLIQQLEEEVIKDLTNILLEEPASTPNENEVDLFTYQIILKALKYIRSDFDFFSSITNQGRNQAFIEKFKEILSQLIKSKCKLHKIKAIHIDGIPDDYTHELILSNISSVIFMWIRKGGIESEEEIAEIITEVKNLLPIQVIYA